jgi:signal transduction histidine kinase
MKRILKNGYLRFEWMHRRFDGTDFWAEVTATLGKYRERQVLYISLREIGEIIAAKQAAEAASISKSQFLSVMSHELRTPLNAIMNMFQLIQLTEVNAKVSDYVTRGLKSSEHLLNLVAEVLDFSSIEAGRMTVTRAPFRLDSLLDEVYSLRVGKPAAEVSFTIELDRSLQALVLMGDPLRLKQVLINLCGNALKFTERGKVALCVRRLGGTNDAPLLEFAVADTGIGMTPDQTSRLFQPFSQVDMSNERRFGGTGLGLVISQRLVKLMGGEPIVVDSKPGMGSRFAFRLALPVAANTAVEGFQSAPISSTAPSKRLSGFRILLVEDSDTARFALRLLLEAEGAHIAEAHDGVEGIEKAMTAGTPYHAVLMDMQMPRKNGLEATRELRARGYAHPIVALTANAFARDLDACLAAGMNDCVTKPVKIDELVSVLMRNSPH